MDDCYYDASSRELWAASCNGDLAATQMVVERYSDMVTAVIQKNNGGTGAAQSARALAWARLVSGEDRGKGATFADRLKAVAVRASLDIDAFMRKEQRAAVTAGR